MLRRLCSAWRGAAPGVRGRSAASPSDPLRRLVFARWGDHCASEGHWRAEDSLFNVANVGRGRVEEAGSCRGIRPWSSPVSIFRSAAAGRENARTAPRIKPEPVCSTPAKAGMPAFELRSPEPGNRVKMRYPSRGSGESVLRDIRGRRSAHFEGGLELYCMASGFDGQF